MQIEIEEIECDVTVADVTHANHIGVMSGEALLGWMVARAFVPSLADAQVVVRRVKSTGSATLYRQNELGADERASIRLKK